MLGPTPARIYEVILGLYRKHLSNYYVVDALDVTVVDGMVVDDGDIANARELVDGAGKVGN